MSDRKKQIRVLQVVHGLVTGGIETWLVNVLKAIDRDRFQIDFVTSTREACFYDDCVRSLGSRIHFCPSPKRPWVYAPALKRIIREGPYDVVHTHLDHYGGFVLRVAKAAGVAKRIAHSHSDTSGKQAKAGMVRRLYLRSTKRWLKRCATMGLAVSDKAGASLFPNWGRDDRWRVVYCGIATDTFHSPQDRRAARADYGLPHDGIVLGHVGGFREAKNHRFLVEIAAAALRRDPRVRLILVGDGPLRPEIEEHVHSLGVEKQVVLTGVLPDPKEVLRDIVDVFVFPSLWEGLPLAIVEAQAAGVPSVISDRISDEVDLVKRLIKRLPVSRSAEDWAAAAIAAASDRSPPGEALAEIESSAFNIRNSVQSLEEIYAAN